MEFRKAVHVDLPRIVEIYNQIIPSRLATADLEPVTVADREAWFALEPFYGRPAYEHTAEISVYIDQAVRHQGVGSRALQFVIDQLPQLGITAIVAYIFGHNQPSLKLFRHFGFAEWGSLPRVAELDGVQRDLKILGRRFD